MCGIVAIKHLKRGNVSRAVRRQYARQRDRGTDGYGFAAVYPDHVEVYRERSEPYIMKALREVVAPEIVFHHRYPTSVPNKAEFAHPILVSHPDFRHSYLVVHNGVIWNDDERRKAHEKRGFIYTTHYEYDSVASKTRVKMQNDSEALAIDLALVIEGKQKKVKAEGNSAFIILEMEKGGKPVRLHWGRSGNPLNYYADEERIMLSSEGRGNPIEEEKLYTLDYATMKIATRDLKLPPHFYQGKSSTGSQTSDSLFQGGRYYGGYDDDRADIPPDRQVRLIEGESGHQLIIPGALHRRAGYLDRIDKGIAHNKVRELSRELRDLRDWEEQVRASEGEEADILPEIRKEIEDVILEITDLTDTFGWPQIGFHSYLAG